MLLLKSLQLSLSNKLRGLTVNSAMEKFHGAFLNDRFLKL
jgi:hypothetical protein